jgi:hypothetical protein
VPLTNPPMPSHIHRRGNHPHALGRSLDALSSVISPISMGGERFRVLAIPSDSFWLPILTFFGNYTV